MWKTWMIWKLNFLRLRKIWKLMFCFWMIWKINFLKLWIISNFCLYEWNFCCFAVWAMANRCVEINFYSQQLNILWWIYLMDLFVKHLNDLKIQALKAFIIFWKFYLSVELYIYWKIVLVEILFIWKFNLNNNA